MLGGTWAGQVGLRHPPAEISTPFLDLENFFTAHCDKFRAPTSGAHWEPGAVGLDTRTANHSPTAMPPFHSERREEGNYPEHARASYMEHTELCLFLRVALWEQSDGLHMLLY